MWKCSKNVTYEYSHQKYDNWRSKSASLVIQHHYIDESMNHDTTAERKQFFGRSCEREGIPRLNKID